MKTVALGDLATINPREARLPPEVAVSFVGMAQLDAEAAMARPLATRRFGEVSTGYTVFRDGDLLAAKITPCWENGKVGQAALDNQIGVGSSEFHVVRPTPDADARYLLHFLRQPSVRIAGEARMTGSAGQKRVPVAFLQDLRVPLPDLREQRRIAAILDQADALRAKRRQVLAHLDALTQSIFHDMFGHSRLPIRRFDDVVLDLEGGRSIVAEDSAANSNYRVLKISAVTSNRFRAEESKPLPVGYEPPIHHLVRRGDLLISRANTAELVGAVALVDQDVAGLALPDKLWRFVWREPDGVEPLYMWMLLQSSGMRHELSSRASGTGGSMKNISKEKLRSILLPWPSFDLQSEFAARVSMVNEESVMMRRRAECSDALFSSLQSRAFRGEL